MATKIRYEFNEPSRTPRALFISVTEKSAPRLAGNQMAEAKFSGTFGIQQEDFDAIVKIMVEAIKGELGSFSGKPDDYYLACMSGTTAARRAIQSAELKTRGMPADQAMKEMEKAEGRAELYKPFAGILTASSKFEVSLAKLDHGKIVDIPQNEQALAQAGKDLFYRGAFVAPAVEFQAFRRKSLDGKDGVTAFLQNCLFVRNGERLAGGGRDSGSVFGGYAGYSAEDPTALAPTGDEEESAF